MLSAVTLSSSLEAKTVKQSYTLQSMASLVRGGYAYGKDEAKWTSIRENTPTD